MIDYSVTDYSAIGGKSYKGKRHFVYSILDDFGDYIYIGKTCNPERRKREHECKNRATGCYKISGGGLCMIVLSAHATDKQARAEESRLISMHRPSLVNKQSPSTDKKYKLTDWWRNNQKLALITV